MKLLLILSLIPRVLCESSNTAADHQLSRGSNWHLNLSVERFHHRPSVEKARKKLVNALVVATANEKTNSQSVIRRTHRGDEGI